MSDDGFKDNPLVQALQSCNGLLTTARNIDITEGRDAANRFLEEFFEPTNALRIYHMEQAKGQLEDEPDFAARVGYLMTEFEERLDPFVG